MNVYYSHEARVKDVRKALEQSPRVLTDWAVGVSDPAVVFAALERHGLARRVGKNLWAEVVPDVETPE